ncbi:OmpH family outer membrane protein [Chitinophaga flava]|uniref:Molecular chaperone Skp n=1 Tax=Chitinophaga flava TaxID=2259036 RepID=A0A365XZF4_9BACT|nr:OmpH family outer membrane protein [Chitinophaga flava]RBL91713.1 hypothetical protein DF182_03655 [Chitinophaga flava]
MSKKLFPAALVVIFVLLSVVIYQSFFKSNKLAYVDSGKLLGNYHAMTDARKSLETKTQQWKSNIDTLSRDLQQTILKYEQELNSGSATQKKMAQEIIRGKQKQLNDYQVAVQQNAQQEENRLTQKVIADVNAYLLSYGKEHHYKMILIATNGNIGYADPSLDITDDILNHLNSNYKIPLK